MCSRFSIIVPVLHESNSINELIEHIYNVILPRKCEIIIVDGSIEKDTIKSIKDENINKISAQCGRAIQMNTGVAAANGEILIFLHSDTRLPENALDLIEDTIVNKGYNSGAFKLKIDSKNLILKLISKTVNMRTYLTRIPYGDQGIFIKKEYFCKIGRYKNIPLMEDVELMKRIKKRNDKIFIIKAAVLASPRRWNKEGVFYTTIRNHILRILYSIGISPHRLARYYRINY